MTDNVLDARLSFALGRFKTLHLEHIKKYKDIPLCKTVTSFLEHHNASTFTALDGVERKELTSRMQYMFTTLEQTSKELLLVYGVEDESDLSGMQRKAYDAAGTNHIYVCTDPVATNYDKTATSNDGRCLYAPASITRFATWINTAVGTTTLLTETGLQYHHCNIFKQEEHPRPRATGCLGRRRGGRWRSINIGVKKSACYTEGNNHGEEFLS